MPSAFNRIHVIKRPLSRLHPSVFVLCWCLTLPPQSAPLLPQSACSLPPPPPPSSPGGVGDVDSSQVDALTAHDEERGEAEQRDAAADHGQLGRLASSELQLLDDVAAQDDAHAGAGHNNQSWGGGRLESQSTPLLTQSVIQL